MGRRVVDQWVKWVTFWMGHMGHGSMHIDQWSIFILLVQQVTVKYRQKCVANTYGSLWIVIFQHIRRNWYSDLFKSQFFSIFLCCIAYYIVHWVLFTVLYTSVYVVKPMGHGSCIMGQFLYGLVGHGSLPALVITSFFHYHPDFCHPSCLPPGALLPLLCHCFPP